MCVPKQVVVYHPEMELRDIDFNHGRITPDVFWNDRHERFKAIKESNDYHEKMDYASRQGTIKLVRRALELAMDSIDEWLEDSFVFDEPGNFIGVHINLVETDLQRAAADEIRLTQTRAKEILSEIGADIESLRSDK